MQSVKALDELTPADLWREVPQGDDEFWRDALSKKQRIYLRVKGILAQGSGLRGARRRLVLCAYGVSRTGQRLACPVAHHRKVRTTNAIERRFREVRRRTAPMTCFNNDASCERIIYAVFSHLNRTWQGKPLAQFTHN